MHVSIPRENSFHSHSFVLQANCHGYERCKALCVATDFAQLFLWRKKISSFPGRLLESPTFFQESLSFHTRSSQIFRVIFLRRSLF
ncbi:hypothetical protein VNO77_08058 [Canavalia gladiata]|uniref:Uncharacterized protein n=1 Tax=Canavalia gladiata TaxID=3824 RepID=A0AAN9M917_CANGL